MTFEPYTIDNAVGLCPKSQRVMRTGSAEEYIGEHRQWKSKPEYTTADTMERYS